MKDKYLNKAQASEMTGLSVVTLWRLEGAGKFPQRRQLSSKRVGYLQSEVQAWVESRAMVGNHAA